MEIGKVRVRFKNITNCIQHNTIHLNKREKKPIKSGYNIRN